MGNPLAIIIIDDLCERALFTVSGATPGLVVVMEAIKIQDVQAKKSKTIS